MLETAAIHESLFTRPCTAKLAGLFGWTRERLASFMQTKRVYNSVAVAGCQEMNRR